MKKGRGPRPMPSLGLKTVEKTRDKCRKFHNEVLREMGKHPCPVEFSLAESHIGCSLQYLDKLATDMKCRRRALDPKQWLQWVIKRDKEKRKAHLDAGQSAGKRRGR